MGSEFKKFLLRGNVVDLAVGVVVGAAFGAVVKSLVEDVITPLLAAVIGDKALPRTEVTKKVWEYIKKHGLQDAAQKTMINADAKLKEIFKKAQVSMFEMTKLINSHLS